MPWQPSHRTGSRRTWPGRRWWAGATGGHPPPPPVRLSPAEIAWRVTAAGLVLALAVVPALRERRLVMRQDQMEGWLRQGGIAPPPELDYEPDPSRVELRAARAALAAQIDPARHAGLPAAEEERQREEGAARMAETSRLAAAALADRPAAWEAAMVLGTATYLSWSLGHDTRLFTAAGAWEDPLRAAIALAPGRDDAARLLAGAYLRLWPQLSADKKASERALLRRVFADPAALGNLITPWLAAAGSREEAFSVIPPDPRAWEQLQQVYAQQADWRGFCLARQQWDLTLHARLEAEVAAAANPRPGANTRAQLLEVAAEAPSGPRYTELLERALESAAPGSVDRATAERLSHHLTWSLERCRLGRCPLAPRAMSRLAGFCRDLDPSHDAMASLITGDTPHAFVLEHNYATEESEDWAPYRLLKARLLAETNGRNPEARSEAAAALAEVPPTWRSRPSYWQVAAALAHANADAAAEAAAARQLVALTARDWPAAAWDLHNGPARLEMLVAQPAGGLTLVIGEAPEQGAAVELRLDDSILGTFAATRGGILALPAPLTPGLHLLEMVRVAGGAVLPGAVRLTGGGGGSERAAGGGAGGDRGAQAR